MKTGKNTNKLTNSWKTLRKTIKNFLQNKNNLNGQCQCKQRESKTSQIKNVTMNNKLRSKQFTKLYKPPGKKT